MKRLTRRSFLAASAALAGGRAARAAAKKTGPDEPRSGIAVAVIGAAAAGIAAARRVVAAGRKCVVFEATRSAGGRCITDTTTFGVAYDRGAHWLHLPES